MNDQQSFIKRPVEMQISAFGKTYRASLKIMSLDQESRFRQALIGLPEAGKSEAQFRASISILEDLGELRLVGHVGDQEIEGEAFEVVEWGELEFEPINERIVDQLFGEYLDRIRPRVSFL